MSAPSRGLKSDLKCCGLGRSQKRHPTLLAPALDSICEHPLGFGDVVGCLVKFGRRIRRGCCLLSLALTAFCAAVCFKRLLYASLGLSNVIEDYVSGDAANGRTDLMRFALILLRHVDHCFAANHDRWIIYSDASGVRTTGVIIWLPS